MENPGFLIIGGGVTGLALALELARQGRSVTLVEAAESPGGNVHSVTEDEWQMELGPNTLLCTLPLYRLIDSLGLVDEVIFPPTASKKRYVVNDGQPVALPSGVLSALTHPLLGFKAWGHLLSEPFRGSAAHEETLAAFVERRLGPRVLEHFVDPFVSGVYAGDPQRLSARAAMPRLHRLEQRHGSLLRGGITEMASARAQRRQARIDGFPDHWRGNLVSFPKGLATLTRAMANEFAHYPEARLVTGSEVKSIHRDESGWQAVDQHDRSFHGHEVVLTTPSSVSAKLLEDVDTDLQAALDEIVYPPLAAVALGYPRDAISHPLDGFGMLIPSRENRQTLGALFSSTLFPARAPEGHALLTCFIGGRRNPGVMAQPDNELISIISTELGEILGIQGTPVFSRVKRWSEAIPQYEVGHLERIEAIKARVARHRGLHLVGNWRDGISVGDCIDSGQAMARRLQMTV
ncbi:protoporphyrinogen oxidase [Spiribacter vilamensis]|uniref:Oxygen-dependent protoporphyrinogen oxidase n=1 Tax=Spiribacter vilamensis TaxID=531306 RepID=A0A4Q8CZY9_9GAMM|nr:protoporphyrinogen oxidase [Spiribacter vilamensis]RZU98616.1 oxygen-dependent protoporphyrinogen oxidase [Spiribacter vilamensis]TVO60126.1 protoporphyrinogen oxidase [Spiribacter vilamensis]